MLFFTTNIVFYLGEPGVFIGKIVPSNPARAFLGYVNEKESQKKIVHDVFVKGDSAFLSGKLLYKNHPHFINSHFV